MVKLATAELHLPASTPTKVLGITATNPTGNKSQILSEDALPTDIATGIVDAGSEYLSQALQYHLDYIALPADLSFAIPADASKYASVSIPVAGVTTPGELITLNATTVTPGTERQSRRRTLPPMKPSSPTCCRVGGDRCSPGPATPSHTGREGAGFFGHTAVGPTPERAKAFTALHGTVSTS